MADVVTGPLVGGFTLITSGGTRTAINLSRPWQPPLPIAPEKCPFCTEYREEIPLPNIPAGWRMLKSIFTPHSRHRLIIPAKCWGAETLQVLGGYTAIREVLDIVCLAIKNDQVEMATFIHVGQSAGQNVGHAHWHLMEVPVQKSLTPNGLSSELLVHQSTKLDIFATGARAGECLIVPREGSMAFNEGTAEEIAAAFEWIITRSNERFCSTEGRPPEFSVLVRISADGYLRYADYCPILAMWGPVECVIAMLEGGPITLRWPHEITAVHLRD